MKPVAVTAVACLALSANGTATAQRRDSIAVRINWFREVACATSSLVGEGSATLSEVQAGKSLGDCVAVNSTNRPMKSIRVEELHKSCTVTIYTDESCSAGATAAKQGICVSKKTEWRSISIDNCPKP
ncbi:hypothetical protein GQ53DRAFT_238778 [Thozetella sp. PMI_491]|nr:hypothetical protein GQ53DRAFT_238778 [Thozetella sp. PMI_491]